MTVINAMIFNPNEGAIVADEQSSEMGGNMRKWDIAQKLRQIDAGDAYAILGGTGAAEFLTSVTKRLAAVSAASGKEIADKVAEAMARAKGEFINSWLLGKFRLSEQDFQTGTEMTQSGPRPIDPAIVQQYHQLISHQGEFGQFLNNMFVVLARDQKGVQLFTASTYLTTSVPVSQPYYSAGTGQDTSQALLYEHFERIPREKRSDINPLDGIAVLLAATEMTGTRNIGVGGTPSIAVLKGNDVFMPNEHQCKLAVEIVKGARVGQLPMDYRNQWLARLVYEPGTFEAVETEMWSKAADKRTLDLVLRGYKK